MIVSTRKGGGKELEICMQSRWVGSWSESRAGAQQDQVRNDLLRDVEVDDPVHEVEAGEGDGEEDAGVLVNVGGRDAAHLLQVLLAVEQGRGLVQQQLCTHPAHIYIIPMIIILLSFD